MTQTPVRYYIAPQTAFLSLNKKVKHQWTAIGATQALGWVDFESTETPKLQETFEATADVVSLGTAYHPLHPKLSAAVALEPTTVQDKEIQMSVKESGIEISDNMISALDKFKKRHGGFKVRM